MVVHRHFLHGQLYLSQLEVVLLPALVPALPPFHVWATNAFGTDGFVRYMSEIPPGGEMVTSSAFCKNCGHCGHYHHSCLVRVLA